MQGSVEYAHEELFGLAHQRAIQFGRGERRNGEVVEARFVYDHRAQVSLACAGRSVEEQTVAVFSQRKIGLSKIANDFFDTVEDFQLNLNFIESQGQNL